jgi:hypothetical protein
LDRYIRSCAERRLHQPRGARTRATRASRGSASAGAARCRAETAAAGRILHNARIDAAKRASGTRSHDIRFGDRNVVARNRKVEVVLKRQLDCILQAQFENAIVNQHIDPRRVRKIGRRRQRGAVRMEGVIGVRNIQPQGGHGSILREKGAAANIAMPA